MKQVSLGSGPLAVLAIALAATGCRQESVAAAPAIPVRTAIVQSLALGNAARYSANIVPYAQVDLAFQSSGYIGSIHQVRSPGGGMRNIDQGDWVAKGTVLAVVREQDYLDKIQQAKAQLNRSQAEMEKAKLSFDRTAALYSAQSATKPDYDSAKAQLDSTTASVSGGEAQVSEAKVALSYCSLRAPFTGWLVARNVDLGSFVGPATKGFTIADTNTVKAVFGVPDTLMDRVKPGQSLSITTDSLDHPVMGRVSAISPAADAKSRVFSVEVTLPNRKNELKSGMIASLALDGEKRRQAQLAIPLAAVVRDPNHPEGFAVMTVDGEGELKSARAKPVVLGDTYGNMIVVGSGVEQGERVITSGATFLKSGDKVHVIP